MLITECCDDCTAATSAAVMLGIAYYDSVLYKCRGTASMVQVVLLVLLLTQALQSSTNTTFYHVHITLLLLATAQHIHLQNQILLCDGCDAQWHMACLRPPARTVPQGKWFCM
jgi:uncharacterized membrane protein